MAAWIYAFRKSTILHCSWIYIQNTVSGFKIRGSIYDCGNNYVIIQLKLYERYSQGLTEKAHCTYNKMQCFCQWWDKIKFCLLYFSCCLCTFSYNHRTTSLQKLLKILQWNFLCPHTWTLHFYVCGFPLFCSWMLCLLLCNI